MAADDLLLILDTRAASRTQLEIVLTGLGYHVRHADSIAAAMAIWEGEAQPIVVVAVRGRPPQATAALAELRARLADVTMIAVGARSLATLRAAWHAGADSYAPWPLREQELLDALGRAAWLRGDRAARAAQRLELEARIARLEAGQLAEAQSSGAALQQLALDLAHQINNPLTPILGVTEMLLEDLPADHVGREYAQIIIDSALRIREVVRRLISLAQEEER